MSEATASGKRRPKPEDLDPLLDHIWNGLSLRSACGKLGLDTPSTDKWLHADDERRQQYARACEGRSDYLQEDALVVNRAAAIGGTVNGKKVDASGAKGYLEAVKFSIGRMAPKTLPPQHHVLHHEFASMSDDQVAAAIAQMEAQKPSED
ncbi:terminase small subunit-like protein [Phenylobacterium conjunctum]|uniref:Phage terminase small subunit n=1 Tax=Phenylobacterium conjunctum TaxID=1298959 RepID=A0ABW3SXT2_9CAUL